MITTTAREVSLILRDTMFEVPDDQLTSSASAFADFVCLAKESKYYSMLLQQIAQVAQHRDLHSALNNLFYAGVLVGYHIRRPEELPVVSDAAGEESNEYTIGDESGEQKEIFGYPAVKFDKHLNSEKTVEGRVPTA